MNEKEIDQAIGALVAWFQSQEIMPPDAAVIMLRYLAEQLILKTRNVHSLQEAILHTTDALSLEIALLLKTTR